MSDDENIIYEERQVPSNDLGGIVYKTPKRLGKLLWEKADPGFVELLKRIKKVLDPNGIMNPGKLCF